MKVLELEKSLPFALFKSIFGLTILLDSGLDSPRYLNFKNAKNLLNAESLNSQLTFCAGCCELSSQ
jgi:hypothetical protein